MSGREEPYKCKSRSSLEVLYERPLMQIFRFLFPHPLLVMAFVWFLKQNCMSSKTLEPPLPTPLSESFGL